MSSIALVFVLCVMKISLVQAFWITSRDSAFFSFVLREDNFDCFPFFFTGAT